MPFRKTGKVQTETPTIAFSTAAARLGPTQPVYAWGERQLRGGCQAMIAKCANSLCSASFHYLREGKVFRMEFSPEGQPLQPKLAGSKPAGKVEHFWLCGACSNTLTLVVTGGKVETVLMEPDHYLRADTFAGRS